MELRRLLGDDAALPAGAGTIDIKGLTADSRAVGEGYLFAALAGAKADGAIYARKAQQAGAAAILAAEGAEIDADIPVVRAANPRRALALAAARFAGPQPATIAAVTGTSGKTSVSVFLRQIWEAQGLAAASLGTIGVVSPAGEHYSGLTTPDPVGLARMMAELAAEGVTHAAIEASSHGLDQYRLDGLKLSAGGFLNLGRDHLDYHPSVEDYFAAKLRLFTELLPDGATAVVNVDDPWGPKVVEACRARGLSVLRAGISGEEIRLAGVEPAGFAQLLQIEAMGERLEAMLPLVGTFQASNALVAAGLAIATGTPPARAVAALETLRGAKGRLDRAGDINGAMVFVDYAHKPDALVSALGALRPFTKGRLIVVFGAGGDRDRGKRPLMGAAAVENADVAIVTDDNPRSEEPAAIRRAILEAAPGAIEIGDRGEAIREAVMMARPGDVVLVAGKGHEPGQIVGDQVLPFSDHEAVAGAIEAAGGGRQAHG
ncbi:MAG: UDP-N-acetylmuramoyl-L-alanyl-D-glutamate--2,6-diaminopimelate ligase [Flavobacteriaceae bacterium]